MSDIKERHRVRMERKKAIIDQKIAAAQKDIGIIIVTGMQHVVITGRGAPDQLIAIADTVTEMALVKHAFKAGIAAQAGIEW